jgi:hypothetical protein
MILKTTNILIDFIIDFSIFFKDFLVILIFFFFIDFKYFILK